MRNIFIFTICLILLLQTRTKAVFDEASWRNIFDNPKARTATAYYLSPRPELEKHLREELIAREELPKDPARAEKYVKEYAALLAAYYSRIYNNAPIDMEAAKAVLANDDFDEVNKAEAQLLLYIQSGKTEDLKKYLMTSKTSINIFLKVKDTEITKVALEIISEAYKERMYNPNQLPGNNSRMVAAGFAGYTGIMYKQDGAVLEVARQLFKDYPLFPDISNGMFIYDSGKIASRLYSDVSEQAAEDFIYGLYCAGDGLSLWNIKQVSPELAKLVDKMGEKYKDNARKMFDKVGLGKSSSPSEKEPEAKKEEK